MVSRIQQEHDRKEPTLKADHSEELKHAQLEAENELREDLKVSSPRNLEGSTRAIPGEPFPLDGARANQALRIQQVSLLGNGFPLGIIPSFGPTHKELGSFALQTLLLRPDTANWYVNIVFQLVLVAAALLQPEFRTQETQPYITYLSWLVASTIVGSSASYGAQYLRKRSALISRQS
ncbi:hypothetical protein CMV_002092 [Castanea mollissima]|uniref:Uncharacterized protein n=1 Tax=Castanea mollissima TaxID=60419 RepID=A0A8J4RJR0_9ROSI|nr:hypothetical protein CMV_002092 [Castanea mollissima]